METYKGTKFKTIFEATSPIKDKNLDELKFWCKEFYKYNLTPEYEGGSAGNLSFRSENNSSQFFITATGINSKNIQSNECFVKVTNCDMINKTIYVEGAREPSSESMLHFSIYQQRQDINAIFHGHSDIILNHTSKLNLPVTSRIAPYGSIELIDSVLKILNQHNFIIIKNHGFVSLGKSMYEAGNITLDILKKTQVVSSKTQN